MDSSEILPTEEVFFNPFSTDVVVNTCLLVVTILLSTVGVIGNTLVIGSVFAYKPLRRLGNAFIVNLAVADLFVSAFINYFGIIGVLTHGEYFHKKPFLCELIGIVCITSCSCSLWSVAAISLNRYVAICHRLYYPRIFNRYTMMAIIPLMWTICFCIDMPNLFGWGAHSFDARVMLCTYDYMKSYSYTIFFIITGFLIPLVAVIFSYTIFRYARAIKKDVERISKQDGQPKGIKDSDRRLLRSIMIIMVVFFTMWSPYSVVVFFDYQGQWPRALYVFTVVLAHLNSCVNSILYAATNKMFRKGYAQFLKVTLCMICYQLGSKSLDHDNFSSSTGSSTVSARVLKRGHAAQNTVRQ
ncbi:putative melatonin receptor type 1C [Apostichopus japonicus]|uniref:Putative melatonin receptor type 1C n=1 Tax=Stichopus japonicus TaxID=307972 RepID=A0A2G8KJS0_STIJA|nr:putative melatonin receptor type 1C [Apostichopus japonicus]